MNTPKISVVKPNHPNVSTATISPVQKSPSQSNLSVKNTSADEAAKQVMFNEVLEDFLGFQSQLDDILKLSLNTSKLKVRLQLNLIEYI